MYRGCILETGSSEAVYRDPKHPFTRNFLRTVLHVNGNDDWEEAAERAEDLEGAGGAGDAACAYSGTCPACFEPCLRAPPPLFDLGVGRNVACFLYQDGDRTHS
jgi:ABC-type dipeptide/oligopeptide/nickel transport system ATPase component